MTGRAETTSAKARLTSKEKGKGKRKRPVSVDQAGAEAGDDDEDDVVDTTKRQFTRSTHLNRGEQTFEASAHDLPSGLAIVPLPPTLLDYQDLVPEGILQALESFVPAPVPIALRTRNQNAPKKNKNSVGTSGSELLRLQKELAIAQITIIERDTTADERLMAMQMLSEEVKLWVTRCRQLVGVLQVVELERDNFKAGEGHAKELGTGFKVKLEREEAGAGEIAIFDIGAELVNTKARLFNTSQALERSEAALSQSAIQMAANTVILDKRNEELLILNHELQTRIKSAESQAAIIIEKDAALTALEKDRDLASEETSEKMRCARDGWRKQLDERKEEGRIAAETHKLALDEMKKRLQEQQDDTLNREGVPMVKGSFRERTLTGIKAWTQQFRFYAMEVLKDAEDDVETENANPVTPVRDLNSAGAQAERSAAGLKLNSTSTSEKARDDHQHDETCERAPSGQSKRTPCDALHARLVEATSSLESTRKELREASLRCNAFQDSPGTAAEHETVKSAFQRCVDEDGVAITNYLHAFTLVNFHQLMSIHDPFNKYIS